MPYTTFDGIVRGYTVSKNFQKLWLEFTDLLHKHSWTQWEGTSYATKLLVPLIEPKTLRIFFIEKVHQAITKGVKVPIYNRGDQFVNLVDTRTVYKFACSVFLTIDEVMRSNSTYLEKLSPENWDRKLIGEEFWGMQFSPHDSTKTPSSSKHGTKTGTSPKRKANDDRPKSQGEKPTKIHKPMADSAKRTDKNDTKDSPPANMDGTKKPSTSSESKSNVTCILCNASGHRANRCKTKLCFCGKKPGQKEGDKQHNPFFCPMNPHRVAKTQNEANTNSSK